MNMTELKKQFKLENKDWINEHKDDPIMVNLEWDYYCDVLCKDGIISEKQYNNHGQIIKR